MHRYFSTEIAAYVRISQNRFCFLFFKVLPFQQLNLSIWLRGDGGGNVMKRAADVKTSLTTLGQMQQEN